MKSKIGSSEPSRYIHQLEKEIINENPFNLKRSFSGLKLMKKQNL